MNKPAPRFKTKEKASVEIYGKDGQVLVSLKDLSATGACLEAHGDLGPLNQGDLIRMTVTLKNLGRQHLVNAEVVWTNGKKTGVSFIPSEQVLDRLIEKSQNAGA